jgi:hypothetical protein
MQLFFIPMIIVGIIVTVWLLFTWVAHLGTRPEDLVRDLEQLDKGSWQQAVTLAQLLRDPGRQELRTNQVLAKRIAEILDRELGQQMQAQDTLHRMDFRIYLCRALGEFEIATGVPVLARAAVHGDRPLDIPVRRAALQALSLLAGRLGGKEVHAADPGVVQAAVECSRSFSDDPQQSVAHGQLRSTAAFALGLIGGPAAEQALTEMLSDPFPDARYNAAVALARHGNTRATERLIEMLDPNNPAIEQAEAMTTPGDTAQTQDDPELAAEQLNWKRSLVLRNALRGVRQLAAAIPSGVQPPLAAAVKKLGSADIDRATRLEWQQTMRAIGAD